MCITLRALTQLTHHQTTWLDSQLNLYGFKRITTGRDKKGYYHELFLRSRRFLSHRIPRIKLKGTGSRKPTSPDTEPNFYLLPYLPSEKKVTNKQEVVTVAPTQSNSVTFGGMPGPNRVEKSSSLDQLVQSSNLPGLSFNGAFGAGGMGHLSAFTNFAADNPYLCSYALGLPMSGLTTTGSGGNDSARTTTATPNQMLAYHDLLAMRLALWNRTNTGGGNNNNNNNMMMMMMNNAVATTAGVTARSSSNHPHSDGSGPDRGDPSTRPSSATA